MVFYEWQVYDKAFRKMSEKQKKEYECLACKGILRKPVKCFDCETKYCKSCYYGLKKNVCIADDCIKFANEKNQEDVEDEFKEKLGNLVMMCSICYQQMPHHQYLMHFEECENVPDEERFFNVHD